MVHQWVQVHQADQVPQQVLVHLFLDLLFLVLRQVLIQTHVHDDKVQLNGDICDHIHNHDHSSHEDRLVDDDDKAHDDKVLGDKGHDGMALDGKVHDDRVLGDMDHDDKGLHDSQQGDEEVLELDHVVQTRESLVHEPPQKIQD